LLLPLTIISALNADKHEKAEEEAAKAMASYKNDKIAQKDAAREIMKKYKISPWAAVLNLAIQFLVLVLLYQVFLQGVNGDRVIKTLYPSIDFPGKINTMNGSGLLVLPSIFFFLSSYRYETKKLTSPNSITF
jgi:membrane protein insertase Oxa1/YidC/SpoIIIJ